MSDNIDFKDLRKRAVSQPLVVDKYTADPSAHVFDGKIYIYPSHDIDAGIPFNDNGDHFGMRDYHAYTMESPDDKLATDLGKILDIDEVPWAKRQMWALTSLEKVTSIIFIFQRKIKMIFLKLG